MQFLCDPQTSCSIGPTHMKVPTVVIKHKPTQTTTAIPSLIAVILQTAGNPAHHVVPTLSMLRELFQRCSGRGDSV